MNEDRRAAGRVLIELLKEGDVNGEISDQAHLVIGEVLAYLLKQEHHQLRAQEKFAGRNASTDKQIAICRVAQPALDKALKAYNTDDFGECIAQVKRAIETDGTAPKSRRRKKT